MRLICQAPVHMKFFNDQGRIISDRINKILRRNSLTGMKGIGRRGLTSDFR